MKMILGARLILIIFFILPLNAVQDDVSALYRVTPSPKAYYVRNRLERENNHLELLEIAKIVGRVKNAGREEAVGHKNNGIPEYAERHHNLSELSKHHFSYAGWQGRTRGEKINLVIGYTAFIKILIKEEICLDEEERRRYDLFCKLVTVNDLVNHVDSLFQDPLYQDDGVQTLIYNYMIYNFLSYIEEPLMLVG